MAGNDFDSLIQEFQMEASERLERIEQMLLDLGDSPEDSGGQVLGEAKRELHTLKGNAGMMGFSRLQEMAHEMEDLLDRSVDMNGDLDTVMRRLDLFRNQLVLLGGTSDPANGGNGAPGGRGVVSHLSSIRVSFEELDRLVDQLAEMVVFRNRLKDAVAKGKSGGSDDSGWQDVEVSEESVGKALGLLQDSVMRLRMVPLKTLFGSLRRIVHDESRAEGKKVRFQTSGDETPLDKALLEVAEEALGHLVRNAVVHGIEKPEERAAKGKLEQGVIKLDASANSDEVRLSLQDDGIGLSPESLVEQAERLGIETSGVLSPFDLLFLPGFTTRSQVDMSSGRGVGLSACMEAVQSLGGTIDVASTHGHGSRFEIRMPLSVSITRAMIARVAREEYALPLSAVVESIRFRRGDEHEVNHAEVVRWRGRVIPLLDLGSLFGLQHTDRDEGYILVIQAEGKHRGLLVNDLLGIQEIVVKGLDSLLNPPPGISGATILGDGRVLLILDPRGLANLKPFLQQEESSVEIPEEAR